MATNKYFKHHISSEQDLIEDITIEAIQIYGHDVIYIPRTLVNRDFLFGEDTISNFEQGINIEMYVSSIDGFEGEGDFASKFGIQIKDTVEFIVSKKVFSKNLSHESSINRPREGDLIYFPLSKGLFEIKFVEHENPFYQLGKLFSYKLSCELFDYSEEDFTTGFSDIDRIENLVENIAFNLYVTPNSAGYTADYSIGEYVYQGSDGFGPSGVSSDWYGTVVAWFTGDTGPAGSGYKLLTLSGPSGATGIGYGASNLTAGITGNSSDAFYIAVTGGHYYPLEIRTVILDPRSDDADDFELQGDSIFDFTDTDPFSEGNI